VGPERAERHRLSTDGGAWLPADCSGVPPRFWRMMSNMPLDISALYRKASQAAAKAVDREFSHSPFGQLHRQINRTLGAPKRLSGKLAKVEKMARRTVRPTTGQVAKVLIGVDPTHLVKEIRRYALGDQLAASLVNEFLTALGPAGDIIRALASGTTDQPDLEAMADVLRSRGYTVLPPEEVPELIGLGGAPPSTGEKPVGRGGTRLAGIEERARRAEARRRDIAEERRRSGLRKRKTVDLMMGSGRIRRFPRTHPIITGEMVKATSSTNVHSFGYMSGSWTLFVRFWAGRGKQRHAGPLYSYFQVEPEKFLEMYRVRGAGDRHTPGVKSPGTFVWERLRILGSTSGHQKDYKLVGVARGYVPRKAVFAGTHEEYRPRIFKTVKGDVLRSELPAARVGSPNRAGPNRGTPNTGRP